MRAGDRSWAPGEDGRLARWYAADVTVVEIARRLVRSPDAVDARRRLLGLPARRGRRVWSARQDAVLAASARAGVPARVVAERLELPLESVRRRRRKLVPAPCAGRRWSSREDEALHETIATGAPLDELARALGRSEGALRTRARVRELLEGPARPRWSGGEDNLIREGYDLGMTCAAISTQLLDARRTPQAISARARKLGLTTYARTWTGGEDRLLTHLAATGVPAIQAAEFLVRTPEAIRLRARRLGLRLTAPGVPRRVGRWGDEEDALLWDLRGLDPARLAAILGRSDQAIRRRQGALGLSARSPHHRSSRQSGLSPGELRLLAREDALARPGRLAALARRLNRAPADLLESSKRRQDLQAADRSSVKRWG